MTPRRALWPSLTVVALLAGCATAPPRVARPAGVKVGNPYIVFGRTYVPADDRAYDARGIASWYGPGFHARSTANGEPYDQDALTAAHKTLPMPSWVEVSNLDNGRRLTVRINDRGPFVDGRVIDLSRRSAQLLGVDGPGLARVRVRRVFPPESVAFTLPRAVAPISNAAPPATPVAAVAAPARAGFYVQAAALANQGRAAWLASYLASFGAAAASPAPNGLWRVRLGPYAQRRDAEDMLVEVRASGYPDAAIVAP